MTDAACLLGDLSLPPRIGDMIAGRYLLNSRTGGMPGASQWCAFDELLARPVVVHVILPGLAVAGAVFNAVRGTARLADYRLARVFDADHRSEFPYIVCERPPGDRLDALIAAGLPSPEVAADIVASASGALAIAHAAGQPHMCLTPRSVHWDGTTPKISGLGIEAALAGEVPADPAGADTAALAGLLYALLTGYWPGDTPGGLPPAPRHRGVPYPPRRVRARIPASLNSIIRRALPTAMPPAGRPIRTPAELAWTLRPPARRAWLPPAPAESWYRTISPRVNENTQPFCVPAAGWDSAA